MLTQTTSGILLRRQAYGDDDLIVSLLTLAEGKATMIAKNARKSRKRFSGILELFSEIGLVSGLPKKGGLPVLKEAWLIRPFAAIRGDLEKTAYASYWTELVHAWLEEGKAQEGIYHLLRYSLSTLDQGGVPAAASIIFQVCFLKFSGLSPDFSRCSRCARPLDQLSGERQGFDLAKGTLLCQNCNPGPVLPYPLSRGTIKQLVWIQSSRPANIGRLKISRAAARESIALLEAFVPYHLGREPKSLKFLNHIRARRRVQAGNGGTCSRHTGS